MEGNETKAKKTHSCYLTTSFGTLNSLLHQLGQLSVEGSTLYQILSIILSYRHDIEERRREKNYSENGKNGKGQHENVDH